VPRCHGHPRSELARSPRRLNHEGVCNDARLQRRVVTVQGALSDFLSSHTAACREQPPRVPAPGRAANRGECHRRCGRFRGRPWLARCRRPRLLAAMCSRPLPGRSARNQPVALALRLPLAHHLRVHCATAWPPGAPHRAAARAARSGHASRCGRYPSRARRCQPRYCKRRLIAANAFLLGAVIQRHRGNNFLRCPLSLRDRSCKTQLRWCAWCSRSSRSCCSGSTNCFGAVRSPPVPRESTAPRLRAQERRPAQLPQPPQQGRGARHCVGEGGVKAGAVPKASAHHAYHF